MTDLLSEVIVLRIGAGQWLFYNVFTRTCLAMDGRALQFIDGYCSGRSAGKEESYRIWDVGLFSNEDGLYKDPPPRIRRDRDLTEFQETVAGRDPIQRLRDRFILCDDRSDYLARFSDKESASDFQNFGNFHQQLGQHLLLKKRCDPETWWTGQKFSQDGEEIVDGPYRWAQEAFLRAYISANIGRRHRVLDLGCGSGYYTEIIAETGAETVGLDPSESQIAKARGRADCRATYEVVDIGRPGGLDAWPSHSFDWVLMTDSFLFYFYPPGPDFAADIDVLMQDVKRLFAKRGEFVTLDPNPTFWLAPWFGDPDRPFTVVTEHRSARFRVVPNTAEILSVLHRHGIAVVRIEDVHRSEDTPPTQRDAGFASEFPLWRFIECQVLD